LSIETRITASPPLWTILLIIGGLFLIFFIAIRSSVNVVIDELAYVTRRHLGQYLLGEWILRFRNNKQKGIEQCKFVGGTKYLVRNEHIFNLSGIQLESESRTLSWRKENIDGSIHSSESLVLRGRNRMTGKDNLGYELEYMRLIPRRGIFYKLILKFVRRKGVPEFLMPEDDNLTSEANEGRLDQGTQILTVRSNTKEAVARDGLVYVGGSYIACPSCGLGIQLPYRAKVDDDSVAETDCPYCRAILRII
jgi:hypothetical protein